jgi:hypothetical protein
LEGLLLHDWIVELNKKQHGHEHTHWISAPMVLNEGRLVRRPPGRRTGQKARVEETTHRRNRRGN